MPALSLILFLRPGPHRSSTNRDAPARLTDFFSPTLPFPSLLLLRLCLTPSLPVRELCLPSLCLRTLLASDRPSVGPALRRAFALRSHSL